MFVVVVLRLSMVFSHMSHLHTFMCDIVSDETIDIDQHLRPSSDDIRRTFMQNGHYVHCYTDDYTEQMGRCHVYSFPFTMNHMHYVTSRFSGGICSRMSVFYVCAILIALLNTYSLLKSHDLFQDLVNWQYQIQQNKSTQASSIIEYPHLLELYLPHVHIDYVEQFLSGMNTRLPCLRKLWVGYEHLRSVTNNFTRNLTRINCAKLQCLFFDQVIYCVQPRDFYLYFPSL